MSGASPTVKGGARSAPRGKTRKERRQDRMLRKMEEAVAQRESVENNPLPENHEERLKQLGAEFTKIDRKARKLSETAEAINKVVEGFDPDILNTAVGLTREIIGPKGKAKVDRIAKGKGRLVFEQPDMIRVCLAAVESVNTTEASKHTVVAALCKCAAEEYMIRAKVHRYMLAVAETDEERETHRQEAIRLETKATENLLREVWQKRRSAIKLESASNFKAAGSLVKAYATKAK